MTKTEPEDLFKRLIVMVTRGDTLLQYLNKTYLCSYFRTQLSKQKKSPYSETQGLKGSHKALDTRLSNFYKAEIAIQIPLLRFLFGPWAFCFLTQYNLTPWAIFNQADLMTPPGRQSHPPMFQCKAVDLLVTDIVEDIVISEADWPETHDASRHSRHSQGNSWLSAVRCKSHKTDDSFPFPRTDPT